MKKISNCSIIEPFLALSFAAAFALTSVPQTAFANVLGASETFSPDSDLPGFVSVQTSSTLRQGWFDVGLFGWYTKNDFLVYQNATNPALSNYQQIYNFKNELLTTEVTAAFGITKDLEFSINVPIILHDSWDESQTSEVHFSNGIQSVRPGVKYHVWNDEDQGVALLGSVDLAVGQDNPYLGSDRHPVVNIEAAYDRKLGNNLVGFNLGYRFRSPGDQTSPVAYPLHDQITASLGLTHPLSEAWAVTGELFSALPAAKGPYNSTSDLTTLEGLASLRYTPMRNLYTYAGATFDLIGGPLSPAYRIFIGANYLFDLFGGGSNALPADNGKSSPLSLYPKNAVLRPHAHKTMNADGGHGDYRFEVVSGDGDINPSTGVFTAGTAPGPVRVRVTDDDGQKAEAFVRVGEAKDESLQLEDAPAAKPAPAPQAGQLRADPPQASIFEAGSQTFDVSGGRQPYHYQVKPGLGQFDESAMTYSAPTKPTREQLIVTDSSGQHLVIWITVKPIPKPSKAFVLNNVEFKFNSEQLASISVDVLQANIEKIRKLSVKSIIIEGHTDGIGGAAYNQKLSLRRAQAIRKIFIRELGMSPDSVTALGFGKSRPLVPEHNDKDRLKNRRVELKIYTK